MESPDSDDTRRPFRMPLVHWAAVGMWAGGSAVYAAWRGGENVPHGWVQTGALLALMGVLFPCLFFNDHGESYASGSLFSAARRHWSGVVGLVIIAAGFALIAMNLLSSNGALRPLDVVLLAGTFVPIGALMAFAGPAIGWMSGAAIAAATFAVIVIGAARIFGSELQWAYAQLELLFGAGIAVAVALGWIVLRMMDWMIARSK